MAGKTRRTGKSAAPKRARLALRLRKRRSPEQARTELMDAAERLLSEHGPDAVGLREVAELAGVSHGLITHYFKTYDGLVEAVFARRGERVSQLVVEKLDAGEVPPTAANLARFLFALVSEPFHLRLIAWAMLSGRTSSVDFLPGQKQALRTIADALHRAAVREAERRGTPAPSQDDVDYALMLGLAATYGYGLGKVPFMAALGRKPTARTDEAVMQRVITMLQAVLEPQA